MEKDNLLDIIKDSENKSNAELKSAMRVIEEEYEEAKKLLYELTFHLDSLQASYEKLEEEIKKRTIS